MSYKFQFDGIEAVQIKEEIDASLRAGEAPPLCRSVSHAYTPDWCFGVDKYEFDQQRFHQSIVISGNFVPCPESRRQ